MSAPAWMPFYVADYLADTGHLTMAEHGAYMLLIMHYWQNGGLPGDEVRLARICRASPKEWAGMRDTIAGLFGEGWNHKRVDEEIGKTLDRSALARSAGLASAAARKRNAQRTFNDGSNGRSTDVQRTLDSGSNGRATEWQPRARGLPSPPPTQRKEETAQQSSPPPRQIGSPAASDAAPGPSARKAEIDEIQSRLREAASLENEPSSALIDLSPMLTLIAKGYDLDRDILPVLKAAAASGKRGRTWRYYVPGIEAARAGNDAIREAPSGTANGSGAKPSVEQMLAWYDKLGGEFQEGNGPGQWGYRADLSPEDAARFDAVDDCIAEKRLATYETRKAASIKPEDGVAWDEREAGRS